ncbi:MAG TPA: PIN domain-containing protein [Solirubrobacteraceae bacterium]|jgi:predicted nucleic acid-binding protein|nr:PIN domain-containing protein [Solirubrobacteraceae bacterium]
MPGPSASEEAAWGELALVLDTSAWSRAHHPAVAKAWVQALRADRLRVSPTARLEILLSARSGEDFDGLAEKLSALRAAPLTAASARAAEDAMRTLAHRSAGAQRIPIVDYLIAAAAQQTGAAVLHYDRDYDTLAEIMTFDSIWLAPPGSLP